jgi:hypothetical protein
VLSFCPSSSLCCWFSSCFVSVVLPFSAAIVSTFVSPPNSHPILIQPPAKSNSKGPPKNGHNFSLGTPIEVNLFFGKALEKLYIRFPYYAGCVDLKKIKKNQKGT